MDNPDVPKRHYHVSSGCAETFHCDLGCELNALGEPLEDGTACDSCMAEDRSESIEPLLDFEPGHE